MIQRDTSYLLRNVHIGLFSAQTVSSSDNFPPLNTNRSKNESFINEFNCCKNITHISCFHCLFVCWFDGV